MFCYINTNVAFFPPIYVDNAIAPDNSLVSFETTAIIIVISRGNNTSYV